MRQAAGPWHGLLWLVLTCGGWPAALAAPAQPGTGADAGGDATTAAAPAPAVVATDGVESGAASPDGEADVGAREANAPLPEHQLERIRVIGRFGQGGSQPIGKEGVWHLGRDQLQRYGGPTGQFTDALTFLPNIHFDEGARGDEDMLVELRTPAISIAGGRIDENSFVLDGLSLNSRFDPNGRLGSLEQPASQQQALFVDVDLVEHLHVWQSNVPAEYGRFLGGVVEMETRDAGPVPQTEVSLRTTRHDWVSYHVFQKLDENGEVANPDQPTRSARFSRSRYNLVHTRPVGRDGGALIGVAWAESDTPVTTADGMETATQQNLNAYLKYRHQFEQGLRSQTSLMVAPFRQVAYLTEYRGSEYRYDGGGVQLSQSLDWLTPRGHAMRWDLRWGWNESSRRGPTNAWQWRVTKSKPWGAWTSSGLSNEGGVGEILRESHDVSTRWVGEAPAWDWHGRLLQWRYGGDVQYASVGYERPHTTSIYRDAVINPQLQCVGRDACVPGEQYLSARNVYEAEDVTVDLLESALFSEWTLLWSRFEASVGLRADYNSYTRQLDLAPRTRFSYDLFGDQRTRLVAGLNRYYGGALITYRLREARRPYYRQIRSTTQNILNEWQRAAQQDSRVYRSSDLDTPYSDEITLGLRQHLWQGVFSIDLLRRRNRDQFSSTTTEHQTDGYQHVLLGNDGKSAYDSVSVGWDRTFLTGTHVGLALTWSRSESTNESYDDLSFDADDHPYYWYRGHKVTRGRLEMMRQNFARPLKANLRVGQRLGPWADLSVMLEYLGSYDNIVQSGFISRLNEQGMEEVLPIAVDSRRRHLLMVDLNARLTPWPRYPLTVTAEVRNLFDRRSWTVNEGMRGVEVGRQLWLGLNYRF